LYNFELRSPAGEFVPLGEVVKLSEKQGFSAIQREDGKTKVSITADLNTDIITTDEALEILSASRMPQLLEEMGLDYRFGGRDEERKAAFADLQTGVIIALAVIYIILAWVFGDYARPIPIMLIIPCGLVGAVVGHWILGFKLTILSFIGLLGLAGILVNDSIILVSRLDERLDNGEDLEQAAVGASRDRLRAVLLTSLTTIGGLIPLMFEKSLQAQFLLPMAITIVFGLALATLLVLFVVPAFIGIGDDIRWFFSAIFGERRRELAEPAE
ncbi:MAG: efflux RND transporter permease subunit, partial [Pseudomonadota bacterium]